MSVLLSYAEGGGEAAYASVSAISLKKSANYSVEEKMQEML
jgi:hypothetical protein